MDKSVIDQLVNLVGEEVAIKAVCNITEKGPVDVERDAKKIERARWFGLLENDSLTLTEMGKIFAAKLLIDMTDTTSDDEDAEEEDDDNLDDIDEEDWDEEDDTDYLDDDWSDDDWEEDDWDDEDDEDDRPRRGRKGRR